MHHDPMTYNLKALLLQDSTRKTVQSSSIVARHYNISTNLLLTVFFYFNFFLSSNMCGDGEIILRANSLYFLHIICISSSYYYSLQSSDIVTRNQNQTIRQFVDCMTWSFLSQFSTSFFILLLEVYSLVITSCVTTCNVRE